MVKYKRDVIEEMADAHYAQAARLSGLTAFAGLLLGGFLGFAVSREGVLLLLGAFIGVAFGYVVGEIMGQKLRFEAQVALCQVEIEKHARVTAMHLQNNQSKADNASTSSAV